ILSWILIHCRQLFRKQQHLRLSPLLQGVNLVNTQRLHPIHTQRVPVILDLK
ncbi:hypothetical protein ACJMK2_024484, partial [Sinanodonta woodiana]